MTTQFDGWGYVHLFDAATGQELDTFAIPRPWIQRTFRASATSPCTRWRPIRRTPAFSICPTTPGGLRALQIQCSNPADTSTCELIEVGGYLDPKKPTSGASRSLRNPADDPNVQGDEVLILASDRDYGLFIFRDP